MWSFNAVLDHCCSVAICRTPEQLEPSPSLQESTQHPNAFAKQSPTISQVANEPPKASALPPKKGSRNLDDQANTPLMMSGLPPKKGSTHSLGGQSTSASSAGQASARSTSASSAGGDRRSWQQRNFVKLMILGKEMTLLSENGQLQACTCSLDKKLQNFRITIGNEMQTIHLSKIMEIFQGLEPEDIQTPLDDLCTTIALATSQCFTFRFETQEERMHFAYSLQVLVDAHEDRRR